MNDPKTSRSMIVERIRAILDKGLRLPKEIFAELETQGIPYNKNSVYVILWDERKKRNLPPLRSRTAKSV